jgi:hypothetical protein
MGLARWTVQLRVNQDFDGIQIVVAAVLTAVAAVAGAVPIAVETGFASNMSILLRAVVFRLAAASIVGGAVGIPAAAAAIGEVAIVVAVVDFVGAAAIGAAVIFVAVVAVVGVVAAAGAEAAAVAPAAVTAVAAIVDILVSAAVSDVAAIESRKII